MPATAIILGIYEITSVAGRVTLHVDVEHEDIWIEADDGHKGHEITEILAEAERRHLYVDWDDHVNGLPELTDTGVRRYLMVKPSGYER